MRPRRAVVCAARAMQERRLVVGTVGNMSARSAGGLLITPSRTDYRRLRPWGLVEVGLDGRYNASGPPPSQELLLHLAIYRRRPDVGAVIHTHSPYATAWSHRGGPLVPRTEDMDYNAMGEVRCAPPAAPGSPALAGGVVTALGAARAVLLGGHGVVAVGATPADALAAAEVVEHQAHVAWLCAMSPADPHPGVRARSATNRPLSTTNRGGRHART